MELESILSGVHPGDRCRAEAALEHLLESGERVTEEIRVVRPDGQMRWIRSEGSATRDEDGRVIAIDGSAQDITEQRRAEQALCERLSELAEANRIARGAGQLAHGDRGMPVDVRRAAPYVTVGMEADEDPRATEEVYERIIETAEAGR